MTWHFFVWFVSFALSSDSLEIHLWEFFVPYIEDGSRENCYLHIPDSWRHRRKKISFQLRIWPKVIGTQYSFDCRPTWGPLTVTNSCEKFVGDFFLFFFPFHLKPSLEHNNFSYLSWEVTSQSVQLSLVLSLWWVFPVRYAHCVGFCDLPCSLRPDKQWKVKLKISQIWKLPSGHRPASIKLPL